MIDPDLASGVAHRGGGAAGLDITGALPQTRPVQAFAISPAPMTSIARFADQIPSGLIRVAQKNASGLEVDNIFGPAGKPIRIPVSLSGSRAEEYSFLMFRGLPPKVTLSAGFRLKESWAVSLRDLDNLTLATPAEFQGSFNLEVLLIKGRDTPAESKVISVEIVPQDLQLPSTSSLGQPGPQVLTAAPRTPDAERPAATTKRGQVRRALIPASEEQSMMQRADALLQNNDVSSARLLFEHLAKNGSAKAALAMGKTYDPAFFRNIEVCRPQAGRGEGPGVVQSGCGSGRPGGVEPAQRARQPVRFGAAARKWQRDRAVARVKPRAVLTSRPRLPTVAAEISNMGDAGPARAINLRRVWHFESNEDQKLNQDAQKAPPRQSRRAPPRPALCHQQDHQALQGAPGLNRRNWVSVRALVD